MSSSLTFELLQPSEKEDLLSCIREIMLEVGAHNYENFTATYWEWQYENLPSGKTLVHVVKDDGKIVGQLHITLHKSIFQGKEVWSGILQDGSVLQSQRGKGAFKKLNEFAEQMMRDNHIGYVYAFPNHRSIHTYVKYGKYHFIDSFPTYILPLDVGVILQSKLGTLGKWLGFPINAILSLRGKKKTASFEMVDSISDELGNLYESFVQSFSISLYRDKQYLTWRYLGRPNSKHWVLVMKKDQEIIASVIYKKENIKGIPMALLMDFAYAPNCENEFLSLLTSSTSFLQQQGMAMVLATGLSPIYNSLPQAGFWKLPQKVVPRTLNLLTKSYTHLPDDILSQKENWHVTLAEFDVF